MVTKEEYLNALKIVETYRIEQFLKTNKLGSITFKEFYYKYEYDMSERLKNALLSNLLDSYGSKNYPYLHQVLPKKFIKFRNVGKKTTEEYEYFYYLEQYSYQKSLEDAVNKFG